MKRLSYPRFLARAAMTLLAVFCFIGTRAQTTVTIGDLEDATNDSFLPMNTLYNYSYTQQIYTAEEIGMAGTINSITVWLYGNANLYEMPFDIYMVETDKEAFDDNTDWVTVTSDDIVYSGTVTVHNTEAEAYTFELSTPFVYTGQGNLVIAFDNNCGQWKNGFRGMVFTVTDDVSRSHYVRFDSNDIDPLNMDGVSTSTNSAIRSMRNVIELAITPLPTGCDNMPTAIAVSDITANGATVTWEGEGNIWNLRYKASTDEEYTLVEGLTSQTYTFEGTLASNTTYSVGVQTDCGGGSTSAFKSTSFTTANPSAAPTNLLASAITINSITLTWTPGYQETTWTVKYKKSSETEYTEETVTGTPTITLSGLSSNTTYNVQIYNGENYVSGNFTTDAGIPLNEAFGTATPTGWAKYSGLLSDVMNGTALTTTSYGWYFGQNAGVFDEHARINIYGTSCKYWQVMPTLVMENNVQLLFELAYTKYVQSGTGGNPDQNGDDDKFVVLIQTESGWEILRQWDNAGSEYVLNDLNPTPITVAFDLSSYAGQNIAIAFYAESTESNADNNLHIDNVSIDYIPTCAKPTGLVKSDVTAHEATITWGSDAAAWQVMLNDDEENLIDVTEATYTFTELDPETTYTAKVRTKCGANDYSGWTNAVNFTTGIACPVPTSFTTSNVGAHSVKLSWTSEASEWVVAYKASAEEEFTEVPVTENPYVLEGLNPETSYTVKVKDVCGGIDGESQYTTTRSFTTLETCPAPSNLTVSNLTATGATLTWTELGEGTTWFICFDGDEEHLIEVDETTYTFNELQSEMVHTAKVKSDCSADGVWSSTVSFEPTTKLVIGSGTATSGYLPTNTNYDYAFTQQIYTVEELGDAGLIESIDFYMTSTSAYTRNLDIYMVSTNKNAFEDNSDWIAVTAADLVFSGEVEFTPQAWTTITLTNPFIYDGTQNVAIIVDDNSDVWSSRSFRTFTASAQQALYKYQDDTDIPIDYTGNGTLTTSKNQIRIMKSAMSDCMKPTGLTANNVGSRSVELSWTENGEATAWIVNYNGHKVTANTNENFELTLEPATEYTITVAPTCDETRVSNPITITTLVACPAPQELTVSNIGYYSANLAWTGYSDSYTVTLGQEDAPVELINADFANSIPASWVNTSDYPWIVTEGGFAQSSNAGVGSSTSSISVTVTFPTDGTIAFDAECKGEGTSSFWDHCDFYIDDNRVFYHGADLTNAGWNTYTFDVTAGSHTFTWSYTKDGSVNKEGDYFAIDNVVARYTSVIWETPVTGIVGEEYTAQNLTANTLYYAKVQGNCGDDGFSQETAPVSFTTLDPCAVPSDLMSSTVLSNQAKLSWTGNQEAYNLQYRHPVATTATIILEAHDVWGDGSGYQMLLDADATAYGTLWDAEHQIFVNGVQYDDGGDLPAAYYDEFEYKIPTEADGALSTTNVVVDGTVTITIPAGTYDYAIFNPSPDNSQFYIAADKGEVGGAEDDFVFEAGKTYHFTMQTYESGDGTEDGAALEITPPMSEWVTVENVTSPYTLTGLTPDTEYEWQVQGICSECEGGVTEWSNINRFTTLPFIELVNDDSGNAAGSKNSDVINAYNGKTVDVTLTDRILYKDEKWNTICLPFDVTIAGSPLDGEGVTAKTLVGATVTPSGDHISLNFGDTNLTALEAGVPYIIKWDKDVVNPEIQNPVFTGVTIKNSTEEERTVSPINEVKFIGYYDAKPITAADENIYYMTANNMLKHTGQDRTLKSLRAYFEFTVPSGSVREFTLNFGDGESSGIISIDSEQLESNWYTIDGKMLDKQPTRKGVYIKDGVKVVIK